MMTRATVAALAALALSYSVARADDTTQTTTAQTLVVITPNAPVVVTNGAASSAPGATAASPTATVASTDTAPHNEDWSNVSHINGSIVPVGERNNYLFTAKKNNIQSDPLAWMFGFYQVSAQHALSNNIAVSVEVSGYSIDHGSNSGFSVAATLPIYLKRTFSGPFLEPGLVVHTSSSSSYDCYDCSSNGSSMSTLTTVGPEVLFGWSWMFDSGLNVAAAVGASRPMNHSTDGYSSSDEVVPEGYFRVGYAF